MSRPALKAKGPISIPFNPHREVRQIPVRTVEQYRPLSKFRRLGPKLAVFAFSFLFIGLTLNSQLVGSIFGIQTQGGSAVTLSRILDDNFNLSLAGFVEGIRLKSTTTSGAPLVVESPGLVENLNSDLLDGRHGAYYLGATTLDSLGSSSFLRSDTSDSYTSGTLTIDSGTTLDINGNLTIADTVIDLDGFAPTIRATSGPLSLKGSGLEFEGTRSSSDAEFFRDLAEGGSANNGIFLFSYNSAVAGARYGRLWVTTTGVFRVDPSISNRLSLDTGAQNYLTAFEGSSSGENREFRIYGWNTALAAPAYGFFQYDDSGDRFRLGVSSGDLELDDDVFVIGNVGIRQDVPWPASLSLTPMSIITAYPGGTDPMTPGLLRLRAARDGTVALVDDGGEVGIGTANPQKTLDILSTGDDHLRLTYNGSNYWDIYTQSQGELYMIGTGTTAKLYVQPNESVYFDMAGSPDDVFYIYSNPDGVGLALGTASAEGGDFVIYSDAAGSQQLYVDADAAESAVSTTIVGQLQIGTTTPIKIAGDTGTVSTTAGDLTLISSSGDITIGDLVSGTTTVVNILVAGEGVFSEDGLFVGDASGTYGDLAAVEDSPSGAIAIVVNVSTDDDPAVTALRLGLGTASTGTASRFVTFYAAATDEDDGTGVGRIRLNNGNVAYETGGADYAEYVGISGSVEQGDIISLAGALGRKALAGERIIGVVSNTSGFIGNAKFEEPGANQAIVGFLGQIKTKVSVENGAIFAGDPITSSSVAGVGMKATGAGSIVGTALDSYSGSGVGRIKVFVSPSWFDPGFLVDAGGEVEGVNSEQLTASSLEAKEGIFEKISSTILGIFNKLVAETAKIGSLTVGEMDAPSGITIYDQVNGEPYCVSISDGEWLKEPGECK